MILDCWNTSKVFGQDFSVFSVYQARGRFEVPWIRVAVEKSTVLA